MNKVHFITIIVFQVMLVFFSCGRARAEDINIAPRCMVFASEAGNPSWDIAGLTDNDIGPLKGWVGKWNTENPPWVKLVMPVPGTVRGVRLMAASYPETGPRRFARPKKVSLLLKSDKEKIITFDLEDYEGRFQELEVGEPGVRELSLIIGEIYADARYPEQVGFQEIQVIAPGEEFGARAAGVSASATGEKTSDPVADARRMVGELKKEAEEKKDAEEKKEGSGEGEISPEEREILDLLKELLRLLEQKFTDD